MGFQKEVYIWVLKNKVMPIDVSNLGTREQQKNAAEMLYEMFLVDNTETLSDKMSKHGRKIRQTFEQWFKSKYPDSRNGYSKSSHSRHIRYLAELIKYASSTDKKDIKAYDKILSIRKMIAASNYLDSAHEFLDCDKPFYEESSEEAKNTFAGTNWHAYFLYYRKHGLNKEPVLGQAVVQMKAGNKVCFINTGVKGAVNYEGDYFAENAMFNGVVTFSLNSGEHGRNLHIKLFCKDPNIQKVALGEYLTYENNRIQGGNIVFKRLSDKITAEKSPKGIYSIFPESKNFSKRVPIQIRDFLRLRSNNYFLLPDDQYTDVKSLETKEGYELLSYNKDALFLEKERPQAFISFPISGSSKDNLNFFDEIIETLRTRFQAIDFDSYNRDRESIENDVPRSFPNVNTLKTKRFFIFFSDGVEKISYSYFQLAWGFIFSKRIILIGKEKDFSKAILKLCEENKYACHIPVDPKSTLHQAWSNGSILKQLKPLILDYLPKSLDGNM